MTKRTLDHQDSLRVLARTLADLTRQLEAGGLVYRAVIEAVASVALAVGEVCHDLLAKDARERLTVSPVQSEPTCVH